MASFHPEMGLIITALSLDEVGVLLEMGAFRNLIVGTVASLAVSAADHKEGVQLVLPNRRSGSDLIPY